MEKVINEMRTSMRNELAKDIRGIRREQRATGEHLDKTDLKERIKTAKQQIDSHIAEIEKDPEGFYEGIKAEIADQKAAGVDVSGISDALRPKWIPKKGDKTISYKRRTGSVSGKSKAVVSDEIEKADPESTKKENKTSLADKILQAILGMLKKIELNTKGKKSGKSENSPVIEDPQQLVGGKKSKKKRKSKKVDIDNPEGLDYDSFEGGIYNAIQKEMDPTATFAMEIGKYQVLKHRKRKEEKAKGTTPTPAGEPISAVQFQAIDNKSNLIKDDPQPAIGGENSGSGMGGMLGALGTLLPAAGGKVFDKLKPLAKNAGRLLANGARFLGPAAAVAGAGYAGFKAGEWINEKFLTNEDGSGKVANAVFDAVNQDKPGDNLNKLDDRTKNIVENAKKKMDQGLEITKKEKMMLDLQNFDTTSAKVATVEKNNSSQLETQQEKTDAAKQAAVAPPIINSPSTKNIITNAPAGSGTSGGKGIGTRNVESSFVRYLDSRTFFA